MGDHFPSPCVRRPSRHTSLRLQNFCERREEQGQKGRGRRQPFVVAPVLLILLFPPAAPLKGNSGLSPPGHLSRATYRIEV